VDCSVSAQMAAAALKAILAASGNAMQACPMDLCHPLE